MTTELFRIALNIVIYALNAAQKLSEASSYSEDQEKLTGLQKSCRDRHTTHQSFQCLPSSYIHILIQNGTSSSTFVLILFYFYTPL